MDQFAVNPDSSRLLLVCTTPLNAHDLRRPAQRAHTSHLPTIGGVSRIDTTAMHQVLAAHAKMNPKLHPGIIRRRQGPPYILTEVRYPCDEFWPRKGPQVRYLCAENGRNWGHVRYLCAAFKPVASEVRYACDEMGVEVDRRPRRNAKFGGPKSSHGCPITGHEYSSTKRTALSLPR